MLNVVTPLLKLPVAVGLMLPGPVFALKDALPL
jgi:hypothetical protein